MFRTYNTCDPFNHDNFRNIRNTERRSFNCGGYALGTLSWYCPYSEEDENNEENIGSFGCFDCGFDDNKEALAKTMYLVSNMILEFEGKVRVALNKKDVAPYEYLVAFRVSSDGDFHYVKKTARGWRHKMGSSPYIERMSAKMVFSDLWCGRYDGPLVLLAVKR